MIVANRYEVIDEVGRGGMGTVVSCRDLHLDRIVVLKMCKRPAITGMCSNLSVHLIFSGHLLS